MPSVTLAQTAGFLKLAEPLICAGLKHVLDVPLDGAADWLKKRFTDNSTVLPKAISTANDRAWQAVSLALAGDSLFESIFGRLRDGDLKAVRDQIKAFVANAETGYENTPDGFRAKACAELQRMKADGKLGLDGVELNSIDLTRFANVSKTNDDAHRAVSHLANELTADAPHLAKVLTLTPPGGGTPLLAAAFAFFLRRQIATNPELSRELTQDSLRWITLKQQAGFGNIEQILDSQHGELIRTLEQHFVTINGDIGHVLVLLRKLSEDFNVPKRAEAPSGITINTAVAIKWLKDVYEQHKALPPKLVDARQHTMMGDALAAAGLYPEAETEHAAAATAAHESDDRNAEAEAEFKQYKDACELRKWESAITALKRAIAIDEKRFRPVPRSYEIERILGAGAFGVVFLCKHRFLRDAKRQPLVLAVKTFRKADLDRDFLEVFDEASILKNLTHPNIIRVLDCGFAEGEVEDGDRPYVAMEYFDGVTLEEYLQQHGKLNRTDFIAIFAQIAAALHQAHTAEREIIHRDVKPANIMLRKDGDVFIVKAIDFGLAVNSEVRHVSQKVPKSQQSTRDKCITGTTKYASPEQRNERDYPIGPHSDVFAFGKTALEALGIVLNPVDDDDWKDTPPELRKMLSRCVKEEYLANDPTRQRFHNFMPIMAALCPPKPTVPSVSVPPSVPQVPITPITVTTCAITPTIAPNSTFISTPAVSDLSAETLPQMAPAPKQPTIPQKTVSELQSQVNEAKKTGVLMHVAKAIAMILADNPDDAEAIAARRELCQPIIMCAVEAANRIESGEKEAEQKADAFIRIAEQQAILRDAGGLNSLRDATRYNQLKLADKTKLKNYQRIANLQTKLGAHEEATKSIEAARAIVNSMIREYTKTDREYPFGSEYEDRLEIAVQIAKLWEMSHAKPWFDGVLADIPLLKVSDSKRRVTPYGQKAYLITEETVRSRAYNNVAVAIAKTGDFLWARSLVKNIVDDSNIYLNQSLCEHNINQVQEQDCHQKGFDLNIFERIAKASSAKQLTDLYWSHKAPTNLSKLVWSEYKQKAMLKMIERLHQVPFDSKHSWLAPSLYSQFATEFAREDKLSQAREHFDKWQAARTDKSKSNEPSVTEAIIAAKFGEIEKARAIFGQLQAKASLENDPREKDKELARITGWLAEVGMIKEAFELADKFTDTSKDSSKWDAMGNIAIAQAKDGDITGAKSTASRIPEEAEGAHSFNGAIKWHAFGEIVYAQIQQGQLPAAIATMQAMSPSNGKGQAFLETSVASILSGDVNSFRSWLGSKYFDFPWFDEYLAALKQLIQPYMRVEKK